MTAEDFNRGERSILERMAKGHPEERNLRVQLRSASLVCRERTGVGFFSNMEVIRDGKHRLSSRGPLALVWAHVRGLHLGMTFLLWTDDEGYLTSLEGAGFGDEDVDKIDFNPVQIEFYDVPAGEFRGFQPPPPSWIK